MEKADEQTSSAPREETRDAAADPQAAPPGSTMIRAIAALLVVIALIGCAPRHRPLVDAPQPVPVGCGPMPPLGALCIDSLAPDASSAETVRCYAESLSTIITEENAVRAQYAPCAK
jgi:hypothetical protein